MKLVSKIRREAVAGFMAALTLFMSIPMNNLFAATEIAETGTVSICLAGNEVEEITFSAEELAGGNTKTVTATVYDASGKAVSGNDFVSQWNSENEEVAIVSDGVITAVGAGETIISYAGSYSYAVSSGDVQSTVTGEAEAGLTVKVYEKPELTIAVTPVTEATYPQEVAINVEGCPDGITPQMVISVKDENNVANEVFSGESYSGILEAGEYTIKATTASTVADGGYYEASEATLTYTVNKGSVSLWVSASKENVYYTETVKYTVDTQGVAGVLSVAGNEADVTIDGATAGVKEVTVAEDTSGTEFTVKYDKGIGEKSITFSFEPENDNYEIPTSVTKTVEVNKIPVEAYWTDSFTKTYDGEATYAAGTPGLRVDTSIENYSGTNNIYATVSQGDAAKNVFECSDADAGTYTAVYAGELELSDDTYYTLVNTKPEAEVTVEAVVLTLEDNVNVGSIAGTDKYYDGESTAEFTTAPSLVESKAFVAGEFADLSLGYTADYYDANGNLLYGEATTDIEAAEIKIKDLTVLNAGETSENYVFESGSIITLSEGYFIYKNSDFETFAGIDLQDPVNGVYWFNQACTVSASGYKFAAVTRTISGFTGTERISYDWKDTLTISSASDGKNMVAGIPLNDSNTRMSRISDEITIGYDATAPVGNIYAKINPGESTEKVVTITELTDAYGAIAKKSVIQIVIDAEDTGSQVKELEWFASDVALDENNANTWPADGTELITVNAESCNITVATIVKTELKKFYYARITDYAGNVAYISSSGVLQDITAPRVDAMTLKTADGTYNNVKVYGENTIPFSIALKEENLASGIADVKAVLALNENEVEVYSISTDDISSSIWTVSPGDADDTVTNIKKLSEADKPTDALIAKVSGELTVEGCLSGLADGNAYTLTVTAYDKAGNASASVSEQFIIDTTAPVVDIDLSGLEYNDSRETDSATQDDFYTSGTVVVTISDMTLVTELNTLLPEIEGVVWNNSTGADGLVTYRAEIPFGNNSSNAEALYELSVDVADILGKTAKAEKTINIDGTAPVYKVIFSKASENAVKVENTNYYNKDIVASILITEDGSYDDSLLTIRVKNAEGENVIAWENGTAKNVSGSDFYALEHVKDTKSFVLAIKADTENHSTDNKGYTITIEGKDKAGNALAVDTSDNGITEIWAMDTVAPDLISVQYDTIDSFVSVSSGNSVKDYVNKETTISFDVVDTNPLAGTYSVTGKGTEAIATEWTAGSQAQTYSTEIVVAQLGKKGDEQTVKLAVYDAAGNEGTMSAEKRSENTIFAEGIYTDRFTVDMVSPTIEYKYLNDAPNKKNVSGVDIFNNDVTVQLVVDERNFNAALISTNVTGHTDNVTYKETEWVCTTEDTYVKRITLSKDGEYSVTVSGSDCATNALKLVEGKNNSATSVSDGDSGVSVAIDQTFPSMGSGKPVVVISPGSPSGKTSTVGGYSEHDLYTDSITYQVTVYDPISNDFSSGINDITFNVTSESGATASAKVNSKGVITNDSGLTVTKKSGNAATLAKGKDNKYVFNVKVDKAVFNSNDIVLKVTASDLSTNKVTKAASPVAIDTTAPQAQISYNNDNVTNETYFKEARVATIEVTERNFGNECISFTVNGQEVSLDFTCVATGSGNRDDAVWRATYTFEEDADYTVDCTVRDRVGNGGTVSFSGVTPQSFTIDRTLPVITVDYDNEASDSELIEEYISEGYYAAARTAVITIEEHNFNSADVVITGTATEDGRSVTYPSVGGWSNSGDVHVARIYFEDDGKYTLDIAYTDLAANEAVSPETNSFVIDKTNPEISISNVENGQPYGDVIAPDIEFTDANYEDYEITLTRTERERRDIDVTESFVGEANVVYSASGRGTGTKVIEDIAHEMGNDGIYTLSVKVYDKAGRSSEEQITYSLNRYGSVYVYSDALIALMGGYHKEISEDDLYIMAYNADELDSAKLQVICDGSTLEDQKSDADVKADLQSSDGWYIYKFELSKEDFVRDGSYEVTLSDKDEAGNTRTNSDEPIRLYVDATAPVLDSIVGLETEIVNAAEQIVEFVISDAIGLKNISVYVDDIVVKTIDEFETSTYCADNFVLGAGMRQSIRIVVEDKAGNILDTATENFSPAFNYSPVVTVSTNVLVRWYANTSLFWGSIAAGAGVLVLGALGLVARKRKRVEE